MSRLILLFIFYALQLHAGETASTAPGQHPPQSIVQEKKPEVTEAGVCSDLVKATCEQQGPVNDGTGTTQDASLFAEQSIQNARDYYRKSTATDAKFETEINFILNDATNQASLSTMTNESCEMKDPQCRARMKHALIKIFEDNFVEGAGFGKDPSGRDTSIVWGCDRDRCKYSARQAEAYRDILRKGQIDKLTEISTDHVSAFLETQNISTRKRVSVLFPKIREETKRVVATMGLPEAMQGVIDDKLDKVGVSTDCRGMGYDPRSFAWSTILEDGSRQITICDGMLTGNSSDFALVFALAHELAHQFDPCFIHFGPQDFHYKFDPQAKAHADYEKQNPFYDGLKCLRDPVKSAGAVLTYNFSEDYFLKGLNLSAQPIEKRSPFCDSDRLPETFADALGSKVLASYFQNPANTGGRAFSKEQWRNGLVNAAVMVIQPARACGGDRLYYQSPTDEYASKHLRLNAVLMANQEIRTLAGCTKKSSYQQCL